MHPTLVAMSPSIAAGGCSRRVRWLAHGGGQESSPRGSWSVRRADPRLANVPSFVRPRRHAVPCAYSQICPFTATRE